MVREQATATFRKSNHGKSITTVKCSPYPGEGRAVCWLVPTQVSMSSSNVRGRRHIQMSSDQWPKVACVNVNGSRVRLALVSQYRHILYSSISTMSHKWLSVCVCVSLNTGKLKLSVQQQAPIYAENP